MFMENVVIMMGAKICSPWGWLIAQLDNLCYCWLGLDIDFYTQITRKYSGAMCYREDGLRHFANDEVPVRQVGEHLNSQWFSKTRFSKARFSKTRFTMVFKAKWENTLFLSKLTFLSKQCLWQVFCQVGAELFNVAIEPGEMGSVDLSSLHWEHTAFSQLIKKSRSNIYSK